MTARPNRFRCLRLSLYALVALPALASAGEVSGTVTLSSDYVYRGQTLTDGNPAVQGGVDVEFDSGWFGGLWASTVDLENFGGRRDTELDFYLGYVFAADAPANLSVSIVRYTFPGQSTYFDYDFTELMLTGSLFGRYSLEVGYSDRIYGWNASGYHGEIRTDWPLRNAWVLSAGVGYNVLEDQGTSNYWYGDIGASARVNRLMFDLRWYDNQRPEGVLSHLSAGSHIVVSVSLGF